LEKAGIQDPKPASHIEIRKVSHGIRDSRHMKRDCASCHSNSSRLGRTILLSSHPPAQGRPHAPLGGAIAPGPGGGLVFNRGPVLQERYVFGHARLQIIDDTGLWIFILSLLLILIHGGARWITGRKHQGHEVKTQKVYMYAFYERIWHWTMALGVIILALTGLEVHYTGQLEIFGLARAVTIHNAIALVLTINAVLSLFYHLATGEIKQFFKFNRRFIQETLVQAVYYISDIFKKAPHPIPKSKDRKLNPLQQLTYIILLNLLLPFQIITGILIWGADRWAHVAESIGGLAILGPIHNLGSWLLLSFLVVHIYLTTTGHTPLANIRAMITGYDQIEEGREETDAEVEKLLDMKVSDLTGTLIHKFSTGKAPVKEDSSE